MPTSSLRPGTHVTLDASALDTPSGGIRVSAEVVSPVNDDGQVAVLLPGQDGNPVTVVVRARDLRVEDSTVPPAPQPHTRRSINPVQSLVFGYHTADGHPRNVRCEQNASGQVQLRLRRTMTQGAPPLAETTLSPSQLPDIAADWQEFRRKRRSLPESFELLNFSMVPTIFDTFAGSDEAFGGPPPEHTERVMDWLVDAASRL